MNWMFIYKLLLGVGVLALLSSLFFPLMWFLVLLSVGVLLSCFALFEMYLLHNDYTRGKRLPALPTTPPGTTRGVSDLTYQETPVHEKIVARAVRTSLPSPASLRPSLVSRCIAFFSQLRTSLLPPSRQREEVAVASIKGRELPSPKKKTHDDILVIAETSGDEQSKLALLKKFLHESLRRGFTEEKIREAAVQAHWPAELFDQTYRAVVWQRKKKRLLISSLVFLGSLVYMVVLTVRGLFLVPYWIVLLKHASAPVYLGLSLVVLAVATYFSVHLKKILKRRSLVSQVVEEQHVEQIKTALEHYEGQYETDLDKLYALVQERGALKVNEVAHAFNISKEEAEEWGKILRDQNLVEVYYPTVGDMEIRWKKSKSIA